MSSTSRRGEFPSSIDSIRKSIQRTSFTVERETGQFISECSGKVGKTDSWVKFVEAACTKAGKEPSSLKSLKDLKRLLARAKDEEAEYSDEYVELRKMVKRGKLFEYIAFTLRSDLVNAYDSQLEKYCLSFYLEAKEEELKAVQEYEQTIGVCRREIKDRMELFDRLLDEADKYKDSIVQYITNYGFVVGRMVEVCQALAGVCTPIKKWLVADADYPRRIQEEIASYTRRKIDLQDVIKEKEEERGRHAKRLRKIANKTVTLERQLKRYKEEHRFYKRREADIQDRYVRGEAELARKKNDLDEVRGRLKSRRHQTTSMNVYMGGMAETIRIEVQTTERKLEQMETQMSELHQDQDRVQKDIDRLTDEIRESELNHEAAKERSVKCDDDLKFINEDIQKQAAKIAALKNIRELKLHSDTVKKIYHYGYNPELILEAKGIYSFNARLLHPVRRVRFFRKIYRQSQWPRYHMCRLCKASAPTTSRGP